jgi:archaellin
MASIAIVPASGSVTAVISACRVTVSDAEDTDITTYDADATPAETAFRYRLVASATGEQDLVSPEFTASADGNWIWDNVIFPAAGSWTIDLIDQEDDSVTATLAVTVA